MFFFLFHGVSWVIGDVIHFTYSFLRSEESLLPQNPQITVFFENLGDVNSRCLDVE